ncbi:hypothetical protein QWY74_00865 [Halomonas almeriensis]|uniref:hypothetical protein n=1 Tax=Halomonas almeriensis TaxID=308163 RepID=UPI0025B467EB|nr:hypothetical protein [Halomonas almeriensis]MDN3552032.1 hypothetical protein [Halomonas almeriensis]
MSKKKVKAILDDKEKLNKFAQLNDLAIETARQILERMLEKPGVADEFKEYIFSEERSEDFKGYTAGEEKGYQRGHESGFAKGAFVGLVAALTTAAAGVAAYIKGN